jgi:type IV pilus assembly protein PilA
MHACPQCGGRLPENTTRCPICSPDSRPLINSGLAAAPGMVRAPGVKLPVRGKAAASFIFGLFFWILPCAFLAIILGHLSLAEIKKSAGQLGGHGRALAGTILGYMGIAIIPFGLIIAAIALPNLLRARIAANESSAVTDLRLINTAEITYQTASEKGEFTCDLSALRASGLENDVLLSGHKHGYNFVLQRCGAEEAGTPARYQVVAYPATPNQSGVRAFCSDESGVIKSDAKGSPEACLAAGTPI